MTEQQMALNKYKRSMRANGLKKATIDLQILVLKQFKHTIGKGFNDVTKDDIEEYFDEINDRLKPNTIIMRKAYIKKFFRWFGRPELMKDIKIKKPEITKKASDMLTEDEVLSIINSCLILRDKTIVSVLYDTAIRVSELTGLNVGDAANNGNSWTISVNGKTGIRTLGLINSAPLMTQYINDHPFKKQHNKPLFISLNHRNYLGRLSIWTIEDMLHQSANRAGIQKKVTPHIMRHSKLTQLSNLGMNETTMRRWAGWSKDSNMPSVYIHISDADANETVRGLLQGEKPEKIRKPSKLLPIVCPRCKTDNDSTNEYCSSCWLPLSQKGFNKENQLLELLKSGFADLQGVNLDRLLKDYQNFKVETAQIQQVYDCFDGSDVLSTEILRQHLGWPDDDVLNILGYLVSAKLIDMDDLERGILKIDKQQFQQFVTMQKRYVKTRN